MNRPFRVAAVFGFLFVLFGAFGAHGLEGRVDARGLEIWKTAVLYHALHALVLLALALRPPVARGPFRCFAAGIAIFSGSLYLLVLTGQKWLGAITPLGGLVLLAGWLWLAIRPPEAVARRD